MQTIKGVTVSRVSSGLSAAGTGSVTHEIKYDKVNIANLQIDQVMHLEQSPSLVFSPRQMIRQLHNISDDFLRSW